MKKQPIMYMLVGIPGSGKSTFIKEHLTGIPYVSSDYYIEKWAAAENKTYNDIFQNVAKKAQTEMYKDVDLMIAMKKDFVWDQTNISKEIRKKKLDKIPDLFRKVAIYFDVPADVAIERNNKRDRSIPEFVIRQMSGNFEYPTLEEGFTDVVDANIFERF